MKKHPTIGPNGVIPDTRSTENSNVGLTEKPLPYTPVDPRQISNNNQSTPLASFGFAVINGYPNQVHDKRLSANWLQDPYWGKVNR